jgi:hypothetical protein
MKKTILILFVILFTSNVYADHYKKNINIKEFNLKQHCSKKKSLLVPASKVFPGGEFIKFNSYSGFDQRAGHCTNAANATTGLYIKQPDVTITMQN